MNRKTIISQTLIGLAIGAFFCALSFANLEVLKHVDQTFFQWNTSLLGPEKPLLSDDANGDAEPHGMWDFRSRYLSLGLIILLSGIMSLVSPRLNELQRLYLFSALSLISLLTASISWFFFQTPFQLTLLLMSICAVYLAITFHRASALEAITGEYFDANRVLGLNLMGQGHLDEAFESFKVLPQDDEDKALLYQLGLEYEARGMLGNALKVYEHIRKTDFEDVGKRIRQLRSKSYLDFGSTGIPFRQENLSESLIQARKKIGRYQILEKLGRGTMGLVYKGLDPKINRLVALKIIRFSDDFDEDMIEEIRKRFLREAEIAGRLSHPGIVTIHDVGEDNDLTYMAMEYLEGTNLSKYCSRENRMPLTKILNAIAKVADALHYAHQQGVIHRDIKPANIMLLKTGGVKVTDFGIAKAISSSKTKTGVILGTPNYMSPEQIMGHRINAGTDIFSLGVLFFQLLTGQLPFHGDNLSGLLYQITQGKHPSVRQLESQVPKACEQIIDKALAKDPDDRFKSAGLMGKYLTMLLSKINEMSINRHDDASR